MSLNGFDISSYQAEMNVAHTPGDFVIVKATQGTGYTSPSFANQAEQAVQAGKRLGIYHYAQGAAPESEAAYFLNAAGNYINKAVLFLDFEERSLVQSGGPNWALRFLSYVYNKTGKKPLIYLGLSDENRYDWSQVAKSYMAWIAQYNNYNLVNGYQPRNIYGNTRFWGKNGNQPLAIFQYTSSGRLPGWGANLDLDVAYIDVWQGTTEEDIELSWNVQVDYNALGGFLVTNRNGAKLYNGSDLTTPVANGNKSFKSSWQIFDIKDGAFKVGLNQWFDSRDGVAKLNPIAYSESVKGLAVVKADNAWTQNEAKPSAGIKHLPRDSQWQVFGRKGKYLIIGGASTGKYIDASKVKIIL